MTTCLATWYVAIEFTVELAVYALKLFKIALKCIDIYFPILSFNCTTLFFLLFSSQDQISELHKAAARGSMREFQQLLDRASLVQSRDPLGATVLHKAVLYGHTDLAEFIASNYGTTALDAKDNVSVYHLLLFLSAFGNFHILLVVVLVFGKMVQTADDRDKWFLCKVVAFLVVKRYILC